MDRIIGIDYGSARTGLAVSDPLQIFASALETLPSAKIIEYLQKYSASETIVKIVIGWPLNLSGEPAQTAPEVEAFIAKLEKAFPGVPIVREDERFTSVLAHRAMIDGGMKASRRRDKKEVDKISAAIILQSYLDKKK
ncbi:MAG: Holliday junction resolvase RuvX [Bacteroidales bacterium]|nr:Holliday junction resolvase RuvX [Bacteroidales bacterium]